MTDLWNKCLNYIEGKISSQNFKTWFQPVKVLRQNEHSIELEVPNKFFRDWLQAYYFHLIEEALQTADGYNREIKFCISELDEQASNLEPKNAHKSMKNSNNNLELHKSSGQNHFSFSLFSNPNSTPNHKRCVLNPKYTFEDFVVGPSNEMAHAASLAASEWPGKRHNPLFIFGGVGLGKTHLMHALARRILQNQTEKEIFLIPLETFTIDLVNATKTESMETFRQIYRSVDVLLIDDIQFIAGREGTQREFFHTFNELYDAQKQIVISSDRLPSEIPGLEERLSSRFQWGLTVDIQPPELETKVAILKKKAEAEKIKLSDEVGIFLAENLGTNVRELEGCLRRVVAVCQLKKTSITIDTAREALREIMAEKDKNITVGLIQKVVTTYFNLKDGDLKSKERRREVALPRQIAMYLTRQLTDASTPAIGRAFGGKDHATVLHACHQIEAKKKADPNLRKTIENLTLEIRS